MSDSALRVYFTIDTETSMGGAWSIPAYRPLPLDRTVWGRLGSEFYGVPLIMDILEEYGFRGTFFTEVFCSHNVGCEAVAEVLKRIESRGHDAQLHLHPEQRFYHDYLKGGERREESLMFTFPAEEQGSLIREGISLFTQLSGRAPRAYRAGCYGASETTLRALAGAGIEIDSSYNLAYLGKTCGFKMRPVNVPVMIEGVREFPVTVFTVAGAPGFKPLEISAVSVGEVARVVRTLRQAGCRDVVLVLHSFSLIKSGDFRYERARPNHLVIWRLRRLCRVLAELKGEVEVRVLGEAPADGPDAPPDTVPRLSWIRPSVRKIAQGVNRLPWF